MDTPTTTPARGRRAPDFVLPTADGRATRFYGSAGGRALVLRFDADRLTVHDAADIDADPMLDFVDADHEVRRRFAAAEGDAIVLDANLRVLGAIGGEDAASLRDTVAGLLAELPQHDDVQVAAQAPVLLIPRVLSPPQCGELMALWTDSVTEETGVETTVEQTRAEVRNVKAKRRRDLTITDADRSRELAQTIGQTVMPEIRRAFHYRATRFEGFKIGCYDHTSAGFFSPHRDNLSPSTVHRRFALSLNLNDDYDGGEVRFSEFGPMRYRPPAGGALVFSGALLHEVLPVTRGRRFVLLSFLWGDDATRRG